MKRYGVYALCGLLIAGAVLVANPVYAQEWYPGEGVEEGLLVKYRIENFDYKRGQPFTATLWFEKQDDRGNWDTRVIVQEGGRVTAGMLKLSALSLTPLGTDISEELRPYRAPIKDSLAWLDSYTTQIDAKSLTGEDWGVIAAIGGGSILVGPEGQEQIHVADRTWDAYVIGWSFGEDSRIWIADNFPLPLRAQVYALTTQHPIPIQYEFELMETRVTDTPPATPDEVIELPRPPLSKTTTTAKYKVDLYWEPVEIQPGEPTLLGVVIFDANGNLVRNIMYNLKIVDGVGETVIDNRFTAEQGQRTHELILERQGPLDVTVNVIGDPETASGETGGVQFTENADFALVVVPEFPIGIALVMASIVGMMVAVTRFRKVNIPKL